MSWGQKIAETVHRILAAALGLVLALQPIGATAPRCTIVGIWTGRGLCCCAVNAPESCCSAARSASGRDGVSVRSSAGRCACEVDAPRPLSALPIDSGSRFENGSARALSEWIFAGARTSASTPILSTASPPGQEPPGPLPPSPDTLAPGCARSARGILALTCVARC
jgi:hypothetical protein